MWEFKFYSRGGQGAVTAAKILINAAIIEGKFGQAIPSYGQERKGAPVYTYARIADDPINVKSYVYRPNCVICFDTSLKDLDIDIKGRDVLIVEDILDSGLTLKYLMKNLSSRHPASLEVATFLWKDVEGRTTAIDPKYVGTHCPDEFVVGYGLDFAERYRNLPYVGVLKPEVYA